MSILRILAHRPHAQRTARSQPVAAGPPARQHSQQQHQEGLPHPADGIRRRGRRRGYWLPRPRQCCGVAAGQWGKRGEQDTQGVGVPGGDGAWGPDGGRGRDGDGDGAVGWVVWGWSCCGRGRSRGRRVEWEWGRDVAAGEPEAAVASGDYVQAMRGWWGGAGVMFVERDARQRSG